jgi:VanZ family protein
MVVLAAAGFAAAMFVWQSYLPTRVTSALDTLANAAGAFAGAAIGHIRKTVHVRFEPERGG